VTGLPVNVGLALRDPILSASLIELLASAGMTVVDAAKNPWMWLVQDGEGFFLRMKLAKGSPVVLLRDHADEREPSADERAIGILAAIALPDTTKLRSIWEWSGRVLSALKTLRKRGAPVSVRANPLGPAMIAIGISTGGPPALETVFMQLAGSELPPIVIVQHMPDGFVELLAQRLTQKTSYPVAVATDFMLLRSGHAYLAPATHHLAIGRRPEGFCSRLKDLPPIRGHRPSAEILFESLVQLGVLGLGVIMTGMGGDGAQGLLALRKAGWSTAGQDESTCAVYGMPKVAKDIGATEITLPLERIGAWIRVAAGRVVVKSPA
jgi:two-component system chemotaxis response regulator CheB